MKKQIAVLFCFIAICAAVAFSFGCASDSAQRTAYTTIASVEATASAAVDSYYALVIRGVVSTNQVPTVAQKFNSLQAACTLAAAVDQAGTNAVATANLTAELQDLSAFILTLQPATK